MRFDSCIESAKVRQLHRRQQTLKLQCNYARFSDCIRYELIDNYIGKEKWQLDENCASLDNKIIDVKFDDSSVKWLTIIILRKSTDKRTVLI